MRTSHLVAHALVRAASALKPTLHLLLGLLRELGDESAYQRHLAALGRPHSREEWRHFSDARLRARYQRAKCC